MNRPSRRACDRHRGRRSCGRAILATERPSPATAPIGQRLRVAASPVNMGIPATESAALGSANPGGILSGEKRLQAGVRGAFVAMFRHERSGAFKLQSGDAQAVHPSGAQNESADPLPGEASSSRRFGAVIEASDIDDTPVRHGEDLPARSGNAKFVGCRGAPDAESDQKAVGADHHLGQCRRPSLIAGSLVPGQDLTPVTTSPLRLIRRPPMHIRSEQILISVKVAGLECGPYPLGQLSEVRVHGTRLVVDSSFSEPISRCFSGPEPGGRGQLVPDFRGRLWTVF